MAPKKSHHKHSAATITHQELEEQFSPALKQAIAQSEARHENTTPGAKNRTAATRAWEKGKAHGPASDPTPPAEAK